MSSPMFPMMPLSIVSPPKALPGTPILVMMTGPSPISAPYPAPSVTEAIVKSHQLTLNALTRVQRTSGGQDTFQAGGRSLEKLSPVLESDAGKVIQLVQRPSQPSPLGGPQERAMKGGMMKAPPVSQTSESQERPFAHQSDATLLDFLVAGGNGPGETPVAMAQTVVFAMEEVALRGKWDPELLAALLPYATGKAALLEKVKVDDGRYLRQAAMWTVGMLAHPMMKALAELKKVRFQSASWDLREAARQALSYARGGPQSVSPRILQAQSEGPKPFLNDGGKALLRALFTGLPLLLLMV